MSARFKLLMVEYGRIALGTYLAIFVVCLVGFAMAIESGVDVDGVTGTAGLWGAAWLGTKLTQPLRVAGTLVLTPVVATLIRRRQVSSSSNHKDTASEEPSASERQGSDQD
ncbi:MAG: DUF1279 domain-containing protein [Nannocystaceae bacterium]